MTKTNLAAVGEPVWYYRDDEQTWWPALRFPNVWTAYAVCHDLHLTDKIIANKVSDDDDTTEDLFFQWTAFSLQQTMKGNQE